MTSILNGIYYILQVSDDDMYISSVLSLHSTDISGHQCAFARDDCNAALCVAVSAIQSLLGPEQHPVQHTSQEKDIGVTFDEQLTFEHHLNENINKSNSIVGIIRRTCDYLDQSNFVHLYRSLVRPHLEYAN